MVQIQNVTKSYSKKVLDNISLNINEGQIVVLLGPSGCGKTTLLRIINGLEKFESGDVIINGKSITTQNVVTLRRSIGYVMQKVGLFPHLTVKENIELAGKIQEKNIADVEETTARVMELIGLDLDEFLYRYPRQLSGGQQQRIGVARAFSCNQNIVLMDEPFSALDPLSRTQLQNELLSIQKEFKKTIIFVTHDITEALKVADTICVFTPEGKIAQFDAPKKLLIAPADNYVANFIGKNRLWSVPELITSADVMNSEVPTIETSETLQQALTKMESLGVLFILVVDAKGKMLGKLLKTMFIHSENLQKLVSEVMITDFPYTQLSEVFNEALKRMIDKNVFYMPVLNNAHVPVGFISVTDIMEILEEKILNGGIAN